MDEQEIADALESTAPNRGNRGRFGDPATASPADVRLYRDTLLRFLEEIDGDLSVSELRLALENYP